MSNVFLLGITMKYLNKTANHSKATTTTQVIL